MRTTRRAKATVTWRSGSADTVKCGQNNSVARAERVVGYESRVWDCSCHRSTSTRALSPPLWINAACAHGAHRNRAKCGNVSRPLSAGGRRVCHRWVAQRPPSTKPLWRPVCQCALCVCQCASTTARVPLLIGHRGGISSGKIVMTVITRPVITSAQPPKCTAACRVRLASADETL